MGAAGDWTSELCSATADERERAWRQLFELHYDHVYRLVYRFGIEPGEVEDIAQRTFLIAYRRSADVSEIRNPGAWLCGIAVRVIAQHRRWRRVREAKRWLIEPPASGNRASPEVEVAAGETVSEVRAVIREMRPKLREALVLCDIEERSPGEVAEILGIPTNTVRSRRRLAREQFANLWSRREERR